MEGLGFTNLARVDLRGTERIIIGTHLDDVRCEYLEILKVTNGEVVAAATSVNAGKSLVATEHVTEKP